MEQTRSQSTDLQATFEQKISEINTTSDIIDSISSQINMLALNASIEAARAGEYGRGFAVVAENIRKLEDDTKTSVQRVQNTTEGLSTTIRQSILNITGSIEDLSSLAEQNASSSEETSASTEEQAASLQELTALAQELTNVASDLNSLIKSFKI